MCPGGAFGVVYPKRSNALNLHIALHSRSEIVHDKIIFSEFSSIFFKIVVVNIS